MMCFHFALKCPIFIVLSLGVILVNAEEHSASGWGYNGASANGPASWSRSYAECGGAYQSPVNIDTSAAIPWNPRRPTWVDYNVTPREMNLTNNGHSLSLTSSGTHPRLVFSPTEVFELVGVHFHWGKKNDVGSEHTFDGKRFTLEMHAVHRKVENGVLVEPPEIIVVAILYQKSHHRSHYGFDQFISHASSVRNAETTVPISPFAWSNLIPHFKGGYFYYKGSLTTPPCSQVVTFFIYDFVAKVSPREMEIFRLLLNDEGKAIAGNFRPLQPLNGRNVYYARD